MQSLFLLRQIESQADIVYFSTDPILTYWKRIPSHPHATQHWKNVSKHILSFLTGPGGGSPLELRKNDRMSFFSQCQITQHTKNCTEIARRCPPYAFAFPGGFSKAACWYSMDSDCFIQSGAFALWVLSHHQSKKIYTTKFFDKSTQIHKCKFPNKFRPSHRFKKVFILRDIHPIRQRRNMVLNQKYEFICLWSKMHISDSELGLKYCTITPKSTYFVSGANLSRLSIIDFGVV